VNEEQWPKTLIEKIKEFQNIETIKRVYLRKIKGKEE
jgi:hypothetical protein